MFIKIVIYKRITEQNVSKAHKWPKHLQTLPYVLTQQTRLTHPWVVFL